MPVEIKPDQELTRLNSANLVEQTAAVLREQIVSGNFAPGESLPSQGELCQQLGISRSVIREAMRTLQSQGLIEVTQGRRPSVLPAGPAAVVDSLGTLIQRSQVSLLDLLEVRQPLEIEIAAKAAEGRSDDQVRQLRATIDDLRDARDLPSQISADLRFHKVLAEASGNPLFGIVLDVLAELLRESRRKTISQSGRETAVSFHTQILNAVESGDVKAAQSAMIQHMEQTRRDIETTGS